MRSAASTPLHVGWLDLHPDTSMNFQLNRWLAYGGDAWLRDVEPILPRLADYDAWRDEFIRLGETAEREGRRYIAGLHFRSAEFFMLESDARKQPTRLRLLTHLREPFEGTYTTHAVPFGNLTLTTYRFGKPQSRGTIVLFGGFDSYVEELFPMVSEFARRGYDIVVFDGPGQGSMLEDQHVPMTAEWHRPVTAVLDALRLDDVTLIGGSLGGCLVIRAAAFESRVQRVVAYDVMTDFHECLTHQLPQAVRPLVGALEHTGALMDVLMNIASTQRAVIEWGLQQAIRVFGVKTPHEAIQAARAYRTHDVSSRVTQDVLLLAGAEDHYVPLDQLWTQVRILTHARSLTARVFTRKEQGQAHCQVGNLPLAIDAICRWLDGTPHADTFIDQVLRFDATTLVVDDPVKRVDNMAMALGPEARMPPELKLKQGGNFPLKAVARGVISDAVIDRPKGYFSVPVLKHVSGELLAFMRDIHNSDACIRRGLFQLANVDKLLASPEAWFTRIQGSKLWHLALLEQWLQLNVDAPIGSTSSTGPSQARMETP